MVEAVLQLDGLKGLVLEVRRVEYLYITIGIS